MFNCVIVVYIYVLYAYDNDLHKTRVYYSYYIAWFILYYIIVYDIVYIIDKYVFKFDFYNFSIFMSL